MFKVFLKFIFQAHWRYSERGAGLARWRDRFDSTYYQKGPWRDRFDNTPKKVLSERSVIQKSIIKTDYQNGRPKKYYQNGLLKRSVILLKRYPTETLPSQYFWIRSFLDCRRDAGAISDGIFCAFSSVHVLSSFLDFHLLALKIK